MGEELQHPHQGREEGWEEPTPCPSPHSPPGLGGFFSVPVRTGANGMWEELGLATFPLARDGEPEPPSQTAQGVFKGINLNLHHGHGPQHGCCSPDSQMESEEL